MCSLHLNQVRSCCGWWQHVPPKRPNKPIIIHDNILIFAVGWHGHSDYATTPVTSLLPTAGDEKVCVWMYGRLLWRKVRIRHHPSPSGSYFVCTTTIETHKSHSLKMNCLNGCEMGTLFYLTILFSHLPSARFACNTSMCKGQITTTIGTHKSHSLKMNCLMNGCEIGTFYLTILFSHLPSARLACNTSMCKGQSFFFWFFSFIPPCIPDRRPYRVTSTKCRIDTVSSPDDGHVVARNM
jgi:hypothetical protein